MAKDLRSFGDDCRRETPNEAIQITKEVDRELRRNRRHQASRRGRRNWKGRSRFTAIQIRQRYLGHARNVLRVASK